MNVLRTSRLRPPAAGFALATALALAIVLLAWGRSSWHHRLAGMHGELRQVARLRAAALVPRVHDLQRGAAAVDDALGEGGPVPPTSPRDRLVLALHDRFPPRVVADADWIASDGRTVLASTARPGTPPRPLPASDAAPATGPHAPCRAAIVAGADGAPDLACERRRGDGTRLVLRVPLGAGPGVRAEDGPMHAIGFRVVDRRDRVAVPDLTVTDGAESRPSGAAERASAGAEGLARTGHGLSGDLVAWSDVGDTDLRVRVSAPVGPLAVDWFRDAGALVVLALALLVAGTTGAAVALARLQRRERDLREAHDRLDLAARHARLGVWEHRHDRGQVACNELMADWLGIPAGPAPPDWDAVQARVHRDDRARVASGYHAARRDAAVADWVTEHRLVGPGGDVRWVRTSCRFVRDARGRALRTVGATLDVSGEREVALSRDAQSLAEARDRARHRFLQQAGQALRTPLNGMIGLAQVLAVRAQPHPALQAHARHIERAGWHLAAMLDDLLDLSLLEAGQLRVARVPVAVSDVLRDVITLAQADAAARGVAIACEPVAAWVLADRDRLCQVLRDVVGHALACQRRDGRVRVRVGDDGTVVRITVDDGVPGLAAADLARLFEPFERPATDASPAPATGLGLAVGRALAEAMGGGLTADSRPDHGTRFTLALPRADAALPSHPPPPAAEGGEPAGAARILVVEDDDVNALCLVESLRLLRPGWVVERACSLAEADDRVRAAGPDLVFLDLHLPDGHSLDHLASPERPLARLDRHRIVVLSADVVPAVRQQGLASGVLEVLGKPFHLGEIRSVVDRCTATAT